MSLYARPMYSNRMPMRPMVPINHNAMIIANQTMVDKNYGSMYLQDVPHRTQFIGLMVPQTLSPAELQVGTLTRLVAAATQLIASGLKNLNQDQQQQQAFQRQAALNQKRFQQLRKQAATQANNRWQAFSNILEEDKDNP